MRLDRTRLSSTCPRSTSSRLVPRSRTPTLSPACPRPAACGTSRHPCTSSSSYRACPRSRFLRPPSRCRAQYRPVTTVPRPEIENTSSIGIRNARQSRAPAPECSCPARQSACRSTACQSPIFAFSAQLQRRTTMIGVSSPGNRSSTAARALPSRPARVRSGVIASRPCSGTPPCTAPDLARQQDVLARLRHRAVRRRYHQDRTVHLRRTRDHVLHVVPRVPGQSTCA